MGNNSRKGMDKFCWEITVQDLNEHAVWLFKYCKDDSVDETIVTPATEADTLNPNNHLLVKSLFTDANGNKFLGYINIGLAGIEYTQPCMFVDDEPVGFWFGISTPNTIDLPKLNFPIQAVSEPIHGLPSQIEIINGYISSSIEISSQ